MVLYSRLIDEMATTFAIAAFLPPDRRSLESQTPLRMIVECKVPSITSPTP